jgi:hypothetical protein
MTSRYSALPLALLLGACATVPSGPSMLVLPGSGKNFDQFRGDDYECRQFASVQSGGTTPNQAAEDSGIRSAALGTAIGAVAGAAIGGHQGAAVGAGTGLLVGGVAGASAGTHSAYSQQQRYDYGYQQCMYAKGHKVPVSGRFASTQAAAPRSAPPPPPSSPPPNYNPRIPPPPPAPR